MVEFTKVEKNAIKAAAEVVGRHSNIHFPKRGSDLTHAGCKCAAFLYGVTFPDAPLRKAIKQFRWHIGAVVEGVDAVTLSAGDVGLDEDEFSPITDAEKIILRVGVNALHAAVLRASDTADFFPAVATPEDRKTGQDIEDRPLRERKVELEALSRPLTPEERNEHSNLCVRLIRFTKPISNRKRAEEIPLAPPLN